VDEAQPKLCLAENVRGLISHDGGRTLDPMVRVFGEIGYKPIAPRLLKAMFYRVPQKRERVFVAAIRKDIFEVADLMWPQPYNRIYNLADALKRGDLYDCDVPDSDGQSYPERKKEIMDLIPPGGYWRDLPVALQKEYMKGSYYLGGGKTGIARRISWEEPCLTLTCAPAMKQTERCHPDETRPFAVREYARIQTFPDNWEFKGTQTSQYKQIGNAVPVNFAFEVGKSIVTFLNQSLEMQPLERRLLLLREQAELRL
jgi:DNA (cytosine-5)-methyltransferase 1